MLSQHCEGGLYDARFGSNVHASRWDYPILGGEPDESFEEQSPGRVRVKCSKSLRILESRRAMAIIARTWISSVHKETVAVRI